MRGHAHGRIRHTRGIITNSRSRSSPPPLSSLQIGERNQRQRAEAFVEQFRRRATAYRSSHLLVPHGDDFKFQGNGADTQFRNLDILINLIKIRMDAYNLMQKVKEGEIS